MSDIERASLLLASLRRLGRYAEIHGTVEIRLYVSGLGEAYPYLTLDAADELAERLALAEVEKLRAELGLAG